MDKIVGYSWGQGTEYRIAGEGDNRWVLVTGLIAKVKVKGQVIEGTNSESFVIVTTKDGLRLGLLKRKVK